MENLTETRHASLKRPPVSECRDACLVKIYPPGPGMGARFLLADRPVVIGRGNDCDIRLNDHSVSRIHARVELTSGGFRASDLQSTNGTFINDQPAANSGLSDGDYLRVGSSIFRFLSGGNVEAEYHEEIYRLAISDALTEVHNHRYLIEFLEREVARSVRHHRPLALVLIDIDFFKAINDQLGHLAGDYALRELAGIVKTSVRKEELFARYGGEEFALVLPETPLDEARNAAERLRAAVEAHPFRYDDQPFSLTISLGGTVTEGDNESLTPSDLIREADARLYQAKRDGRNRVVM
jgi:two-component system cell cycle response regulator